jgi:DNA-binding response OmpR family regulator
LVSLSEASEADAYIKEVLMGKIWIVEDEPDIANLVAHHVRRDQFHVEIFHDGESFLAAVAGREIPDLVILDLMLPGISGLDICRTLRKEERTRNVPIIMLTARDTETDIVRGLELGADDYVVKPFSVGELMARIKAVLRRTEQSKDAGTDNMISIEDLSMDLDSFEAKIDNTPVELTYAEFRIV